MITSISVQDNVQENPPKRPKRQRPRKAIIDPEAFNRALRARLRRLRERANLTQVDVAEALGMPSRSYQHFEGRSPLPAYLIPAFAEIVGCSIEDVLIDRKHRRTRPAHRGDGAALQPPGRHETGSRDGGANTG